MKPMDNKDNSARCICPACALHTDCNRKKNELLFCGRNKSECAMDQKRMCICGDCPVYGENDLSGGYFCINELK